ncbi:TonB-dependent siderophore receptor [bacterium M00.F.Ca.ET.228.01.1.1]|uniref:TonB-dependent receptor family protein n=1 Tax=Paraburkholderia phenoliruptrix TaxID=252970 RepID=UPI001092799B|nr:TonB-dependent siderophore receptor [Paraburkholderia phenoliruptrix]TGP39825.1 TonB-dependent siderophore receptor [bacterium M00.F.Ca.ET.228.01.1.1]TGR95686.1 TonB-dependent siderophore receptor [bacterium M00.F.Ca.ET.191.01.1.1]TGT96702.1 TonB-dependent siderophore receptor [bacterium M00.F.Ca.ET.155.01.1.1]MBW0448095.1 TonB-dependent siderophore receptor [Paraburkholderia phenoliruptrix]MBW9100202.1 TonB-dependent siderophore receptor [Paraburkholderia phenoliruptrix]
MAAPICRRANAAGSLHVFAALAALAFASHPGRAHAQSAETAQTLDTSRTANSAADPRGKVAGTPDGAHADATKDTSTTLETITTSGDWLGSGLQNSVKTFAGARTVVDKAQIEQSGATSIGDVLRRIPGVQSTDNSGTAGSAISLNIGVRGLTGRYTPRSTVLLDGIPLAVAPYGQPQLSFAPISLFNIDSIDVVRSGGSVRYGPQNVGGVINFRTREIPSKPGLTADATLRENIYTAGGGANTQYSTFLGTQLDNGLGVALLYSGEHGRDWRDGSKERVNDLQLKWRYELTPSSEIYGKFSYYDVYSGTPGGLTVAQYNQNPFQNTRPNDYWYGDRKAFDIGYLNTISDTQEFEVRTFYNQSYRTSSLVNAAGTQMQNQPRNYHTLGVEPRYTQRFTLGPVRQDVTVGYRFIRETGNDNSYNQAIGSGLIGPTSTFENTTNAHAVYIDDKIAWGRWRLTPGIRFEHIESTRHDLKLNQTFETNNNKPLPAINLSYLATPQLTLFTDYSTSFGPVQNIQLNSQSAANPLQPELAKTFEFGARWTSRQIHAEVTAFNMLFDNQILQVPGLVPATFQNIGATRHQGIETAFDYAFADDGPLAGLDAYANFTYTKAIQKSGATAGLDVPFYSRITDTLGVKYATHGWTFNVSTTHQSAQYADLQNTVAETANGGNGRIPGFRVWDLQADYRIPGWKGSSVTVGLNNVTDKRYYTRNVDGNLGRMVGAPRMVYVQGHFVY